MTARRRAAAVLRWLKAMLTVAAAAASMFLAAFWLDWTSAPPGAPPDLIHALSRPDVDQARQTLGGLGEIMAAILGLALTVSSIIVQLAATRFTPHVTTLFFRARVNMAVMGFFVSSGAFVLWMNAAIGSAYVPRWGTLAAVVLMTVSLLALFPYFAYVFDFLDPEKIVDRITADGLRAAHPTAVRTGTIEAAQQRAVQSVEHLANIGLNALQQKDKGIASGAVGSLLHFVERYGAHKRAMPSEWLGIAEWNRQSPDFVSLSDEAVEDLRQRGTWLEWKILRQYQMLFGDALGQIEDICYLVAINTRRMGEAAAAHGDVHVLDLAIKFFNTYLRATINATDIRTAYNILHQYRQLAEACVAMEGKDGTAEHDLSRRAVDVARFMRYYSTIAYQRGMTFVTEVIAHDVGALCEYAFRSGSKHHDELLRVFLTVDEQAETEEQEKSLRGVRRAQVKLATTYLVAGATELASRIQRDMTAEPASRLRSIWHELQTLQSRDFWEVNDRGSNFNYLGPAQKEQLAAFFAAFPSLHGVVPDPARERVTLPPLS